MTDLVLVHPPVALPCEPPAGIGVLAAALRARGLSVVVLDANVEALESLLASVSVDTASTTADRRAVLARPRALAQLRSVQGYVVLDRYRAAVRHLTQLLQQAGRGAAARVGLADYHEAGRSPLRSADLRAAAEAPEESPFWGPFVALAERIAAHRPRRIGISVGYLHQALPAMALAGVLRRRLPDVPLLLGGALTGGWRGRLAPEGLRPAIARVVFGDGVAPILEELGRGAEVAPPAITAPDYAGLPWESYLAPRRIAPVATSRGCVWGRCRYCPEAALGEPFAALRPEEVGAAVDAVRRRSEAELLHVTDSAIPQPTLLGLARQRWSARWYGFTRFYPDLADAEVCRALRRSGCQMLQLGLESGSRRVLARLRKGIALELVGATLSQLADAGIAVYLYVMFGVPGESRDDALRTTEIVAANAERISYLNTSLLNLPVCTPAEPDVRRVPFGADGDGDERGAEEENDLSLYSGFVAAEGWDRRAARHFLEREFARHPRISPVLRRTPPVFGANHAPFFGEW